MVISNTHSSWDAKSPPRTAPPEMRRAQLMEATIESISRYGIAGTTMKKVTGIAGLSMGIVNFHFQNKETLFQETLRYLGQEHRNRWSKGLKGARLTPTEKLLGIIDAHFHPDICNRRKLTVWFGFYGEAAYRAAYRKIMSEIDNERWEKSAELIGQIIKDGGYEGLVAEEISDTLEGLYDGFWLNILLYPGTFAPADARERIHDYLAGTFPRHIQRPS